MENKILEPRPNDKQLVDFTVALDDEYIDCVGYYDARADLYYSGHDAFTPSEVTRWGPSYNHKPGDFLKTFVKLHPHMGDQYDEEEGGY